MTDGCGRTIDYLRLSVTDRCNYRCRYCMPEEGVCKRDHRDMLTLEELAEVAAACVGCGVRKIRLTGGEPLVRRGIVELCRQLRAIPGLRELCLTTNGSLLPDLAAPLRAAGVDYVWYDRPAESGEAWEPERVGWLRPAFTAGAVTIYEVEP